MAITSAGKSDARKYIQDEWITAGFISIKTDLGTQLIEIAGNDARVAITADYQNATMKITVTLSETDSDIAVGDKVKGFSIRKDTGGTDMITYTAADAFTFAAGESIIYEEQISLN